MMDTIFSSFASLSFLERSLGVGIFLSLSSGVWGAFLLQKKETFLANGLAHMVFGGVGLSLLMGFHPLDGATFFAFFFSFFLIWMKKRSLFSSESLISLFYALSMSVGIIALSLRGYFTADIFSWLFGSLVAVENSDLWKSAFFAILTFSLFPLWRQWAYSIFHHDLARLSGIRVNQKDYWFAFFIAGQIILAVQMVGIVLTSAYLVVPAMAARLFSKRFIWLIWISVLFSVSTTVLGIFLSVKLDWPSGASIVVLQILCFFFLLALSFWSPIRARKAFS